MNKILTASKPHFQIYFLTKFYIFIPIFLKFVPGSVMDDELT